MSIKNPARSRAIDLMRETLALLDQAGDDLAAIHVQWALDIATRAPVKLKTLGCARNGNAISAGRERGFDSKVDD